MKSQESTMIWQQSTRYGSIRGNRNYDFWDRKLVRWTAKACSAGVNCKTNNVDELQWCDKE